MRKDEDENELVLYNLKNLKRNESICDKYNILFVIYLKVDFMTYFLLFILRLI